VEVVTSSSTLDGCLRLDLGIKSGLMNGFDGLRVHCKGLHSVFLWTIWSMVLMERNLLVQEH